MSSTLDNSAVLKREHDASKGSFIAAFRFDLRWDNAKFIELCTALHAAAKEYSGSKTLSRDLSQLFWYCGTFVPMWIEQSDFRVGQPNINYGKAIELLKRIGNAWFGDECQFTDEEFADAIIMYAHRIEL